MNALKKFRGRAERLFSDIKAELSNRSSGKDDEASPWKLSNPSKAHLEALVRSKILKISKDMASFEQDDIPEMELVNLVEFLPQAKVALQIDSDLRTLRYKLVPKRMNEDVFWTKYFALCIRAHNLAAAEYKARDVIQLDVEDDEEDNNAIPQPRKKPRSSVPRASAALSAEGIKYLAGALEVAKYHSSMASLAHSQGDPNPEASKFWKSKKGIEEWTPEKCFEDLDSDELYALYTLFDVEASAPMERVEGLAALIGGAPPASLLGCCSLIFSVVKEPHLMARFWLAVCHLLHWHWHFKIPLPRMPNPERKRFTLDSENAKILDANEPESPTKNAHIMAQIDETDLASIDVRYCIVHQQLALLNGCITTIQRQRHQKKILDLYPGHQGALKKMKGVFLFEDKDEPLYIPATQDPPLLVESDLREAEDLVMRLNSLGMGAKSLQLDIAAFKAANPKAKLPDFVRWYSPPDVDENGVLSKRMQKGDNLWMELWNITGPQPAVLQNPILDAEERGEGALKYLETVAPSELFELAFLTSLSAAHMAALAAPDADSEPLKGILSKMAHFAATSCGRGMSMAKIIRLCNEVEALEEAVKQHLVEQKDRLKVECTASGEHGGRSAEEDEDDDSYEPDWVVK